MLLSARVLRYKPSLLNNCLVETPGGQNIQFIKTFDTI